MGASRNLSHTEDNNQENIDQELSAVYQAIFQMQGNNYAKKIIERKLNYSQLIKKLFFWLRYRDNKFSDYHVCFINKTGTGLSTSRGAYYLSNIAAPYGNYAFQPNYQPERHNPPKCIVIMANSAPDILCILNEYKGIDTAFIPNVFICTNAECYKELITSKISDNVDIAAIFCGSIDEAKFCENEVATLKKKNPFSNAEKKMLNNLNILMHAAYCLDKFFQHTPNNFKPENLDEALVKLANHYLQSRMSSAYVHKTAGLLFSPERQERNLLTMLESKPSSPSLR